MSLVRSLVRKLGLFWGYFSQIQQYLNSIFWQFWYYFTVSFSIHFLENYVAFHKIYSKAYINIIPIRNILYVIHVRTFDVNYKTLALLLVNTPKIHEVPNIYGKMMTNYQPHMKL